MTMGRNIGLFICLGTAACTDPNVNEYVDRLGIITGTVLYQVPPSANPCVDAEPRGNVIVTLFKADDLPPPDGASGPINFVVVPASELFSDDSDNGLYSAPYVLPTVPEAREGRFQVRAFLDADGDFRPTIPLMAQATAGDVGGGHVDANGDFVEIEVGINEVTAQVTVSVGQAFPVERPAFRITSDLSYEAPYVNPQTMTLVSNPIQRTDIVMRPECTQFLVQYADADGDGEPDDANGDNLPDVYPQVLVRLQQSETETRNIAIPGVVDPLPYRAALDTVGAALTSSLSVILPPVAVDLDTTPPTVLEAIPTGTYEVVVISGTGQTWQVPNNIDAIQPTGGPDPTQSQVITIGTNSSFPSGSIDGTIQIDTATEGDVSVIAFSATDPPPPEGGGTPRGLASVPASAFGGQGAGRTAPFTIRGLADGAYVLVALLDANDDFSPLVDLVAQPNGGDFVGRLTTPISVTGGGASAPGPVVVDTLVPTDRPAFAFDGPETFSQTGLPGSIRLKARAVPLLGITEESAAVPIVATDADDDGDNFLDLRPRVLLTKIADAGDPRTAADDPDGTLIPGVVDPIAFSGRLGPTLTARDYTVILPPVALRPNDQGGLDRVTPVPPGRYRVNVLSATGQTWSVPNDLDFAIGTDGTPLSDPAQAAYVTIEPAAIPGGVITGNINLVGSPPEGAMVVIIAFNALNPPPPQGSGQPVATALVPAAGNMSYTLAPLPTGTYVVRAFLDADNDFTPWFDVLSQPDAGDWLGGYVDGSQNLIQVMVDGQGAPVTGIGVSLSQAATVPTDRPAFTTAIESPILDPSSGNAAVTLNRLVANNDVLAANGIFPVQWVDLNGDRIADDVNGDGQPDVYPLVFADRLADEDPTLQTLDPEGIRIFGRVAPSQFGGFPANDTTAVDAVALATDMTVTFPNVAFNVGSPGNTFTPPDGRYRITLVNGGGQTWSIPNDFVRAEGTPLPGTQGRYLTVRE